MRIAIVTPDYPPDPIGGAGISCRLLVDQLRQRGQQVDVYALTGATGEMEGLPGPEGADVRLPRPRSLLMRNALAAGFLRRTALHYDVVHIYEASLLPAGRMIRGLLRQRVPVVATLNNLRAACFAPELALRDECDCGSILGSLGAVFANPEPSSRLRGVLYVWPTFHVARRISRGLTQYIALSEDTRQQYVRAGFDEKRVAVIPNMYDPEHFGPRERQEPSGKPLRVLCVGQIDHRKGVLDLVRAFGQLPERLRGETELAFLGRGKEEAALRGLAAERGIEDRVQVRHVPYQELPTEYERAHVAAMPARWPEPFGRNKLEAMAFSLPIVTSDHGSAREVLGDAALYHAPHDVDDLAAKLGRLLRDADLRRELGEAGRKRLAAYEPERIVPRMMELYGQLI
ncbi:MAG: glycosyltransferase family 4 protein [Armatimonadota bacterium]